jgi:gliding motility-associated lipoprotein GldD
MVIALSLFWVGGCTGEEYSAPKPWGFHRIDLPKQTSYKTFENSTCPFTFEYPNSGEITRQSQDSCWADISFPAFNAKWHISHHPVTSTKNRQARFEDFRKLVFKHSKKASTIADTPFESPQGKGMKYEVYGNVGTPLELFFFNEKHTMTLDFYFNTALRNDSLEPVIQYMKKEIDHTMQTFKWKD